VTPFADLRLTCRDCGLPFLFTSEERGVFASHGLSHPPSRCTPCRAQRKSRQEQVGGARPAPGFRDRRQQFTATTTTTTCGACGKPAVVPFSVRPDRVVYCRACFELRDSSTERTSR
jgi:CxxC-x17-CxxC domain-containing protein